MKRNPLSIPDIHEMRYENFKNTENMTLEELIAYTKKNAEIVKQRLKRNR